MSELQKTKQELKEVLDRIPASGSFEGADLAQQASNLIERLKELKTKETQLHSLASAPTPTPESAEGSEPKESGSDR
jgi:hypothetical protein